MSLFEERLTSTLNQGPDTANIGQPQAAVGSQQAGTAPTGVYAQAQAQNGNQAAEIIKTRNQLLAQRTANLPIDQKIALALQKCDEAEKVAYRNSRDISEIDRKLDGVFKNLSSMITRVAKGQPPTEPDPPNSSIWDEGDPESIM